MSELKKCPFCGGEAEEVAWRNQSSWETEHGIACNCGILLQGGRKSFTREEAINAWNTRKPVERVLERVTSRLIAYKMYSELNYPKIDIVTKEIDKIREIIKEEVG